MYVFIYKYIKEDKYVEIEHFWYFHYMTGSVNLTYYIIIKG